MMRVIFIVPRFRIDRAKIRKIPHIFPTSAKKCLIEIFHVKLLDIHILLIINEINVILFILASIFILIDLTF